MLLCYVSDVAFKIWLSHEIKFFHWLLHCKQKWMVKDSYWYTVITKTHFHPSTFELDDLFPEILGKDNTFHSLK
jgi:hypothetical protein